MRSFSGPAELTHSSIEAFFISTTVVALDEMGDKTQLLALLLAARFRKPGPLCGAFWSPRTMHAASAATFMLLGVLSLWFAA